MLERIQQHHAVRVIQRAWRAWLARREAARLVREDELDRGRRAAVNIERRWRGVLARRRCLELQARFCV